jgi:hypothetical protein
MINQPAPTSAPTDDYECIGVADRLEIAAELAAIDLRCGYCGHKAGCFCKCPTDKPLHKTWRTERTSP